MKKDDALDEVAARLSVSFSCMFVLSSLGFYTEVERILN